LIGDAAVLITEFWTTAVALEELIPANPRPIQALHAEYMIENVFSVS
jgi:hypothetical protein